VNNKTKFEDLYVELENLTVKDANDEKMYKKLKELYDKRINPYYSNYEFINFCRKCRNEIFHESMGRDYMIFTDECINKLESIVDEIKNPPTVYSKSVKNVVSADITDNVKDIMNIMNIKDFTHIPIYEDNKLIGVFSEEAIFKYLYNNVIVEIDEKYTFNDIRDCINLEYSKENIKFISRDTSYNKVVYEFIRDYRQGKKLNCILITQNGKFGEKVIGILTTWDIIGKY